MPGSIVDRLFKQQRIVYYYHSQSRLKFESRRNTNRDIATHTSNQTSIFQFDGFFSVSYSMNYVLGDSEPTTCTRHRGNTNTYRPRHRSNSSIFFSICDLFYTEIFNFLICLASQRYEYSVFWISGIFFDILEYSHIFTDISSALFDTSKYRKNNTHLFF